MTRDFSVTGRRVIVLGAGESGLAAAELLASRGASVTVSDTDPASRARLAPLEARGVQIDIGPHEPALLRGADLVVLSPGVAPDQPAIQAARRAGVEVIGEVELAWRWLRGRVIAVTGTKGKSTTTTLIARMLQADGREALAGGNLGTPLSRQVALSRAETIHVVEVSSFQLETIDTFRPWIAVLLNLSPDHLDRHASFDAYARAKARIFRNQTADDHAVVNADDPAALALAACVRARRWEYSLERQLDRGVVVIDGVVTVRLDGGARVPLLPVSSVRLPGRHLLGDVLAASAAASLVGASAEAIHRAVGAFGGLEHALETVAEVAGVRFINDSKATNVVSVRRSIESFDAGVVAIMGGRYKGGAFEDLRDVVRDHAVGVVAIGEAAPLIADALRGVVPVVHATSMRQAVQEAFALAPPNGVVVLAPGCSSFDMFANYRERGDAFREEVRTLAGTEQSRGRVSRGHDDGAQAG